MSIVEAGLNNVLVVSSKVGGIESLYGEEEIVFFQPSSIESLIETLSAILSDITKYNTYSVNLAKKVASFNWENVRDKWMNSLNIKTQ
jgi:glycosyltransferase involved in cell wall biosynthesis